MLHKAKESWELAEDFRNADVGLNFSANRFYYSLYQIADEFNRSPNGKKFKKAEKQSFHKLMIQVVRDSLPIGKTNLLDAFNELRDLRVQADYTPEEIELSDLDDGLVDEAKELFTLFEAKLT